MAFIDEVAAQYQPQRRSTCSVGALLAEHPELTVQMLQEAADRYDIATVTKTLRANYGFTSKSAQPVSRHLRGMCSCPTS